MFYTEIFLNTSLVLTLGGLGKDKSVTCVPDLIVDNFSMQKILNGSRIKTGREELALLIVIEQYYCDKYFCKNQTGVIAISGVKFNQMFGTYAEQLIHVACSNGILCTKG